MYSTGHKPALKYKENWMSTRKIAARWRQFKEQRERAPLTSRYRDLASYGSSIDRRLTDSNTKGLVYRREKREEGGLALLFARASARDHPPPPPVSRATEARVLFSHSTPVSTRLSTWLSTLLSTRLTSNVANFTLDGQERCVYALFKDTTTESIEPQTTPINLKSNKSPLHTN